MIGTMTVLRSLVLILSVTSFVMFAYLLGHGLALGLPDRMLIGAGFLAFAIVLFRLQTRRWTGPAHSQQRH